MSYLGSPFHEFWSRCGESHIHPDDKPFLSFERGALRATKLQVGKYRPCPFDGPLDHARVIVCLANPNYSNLASTDVNRLVQGQRSGVTPLPAEWDQYYQPRIAGPIGASMADVREFVSVLNVCPYASITMDDPEVRLAAGLPSVWAAQKHLREVLIPRAKTGNIFLVIIRKHQLWGVTEGFDNSNIAVVRGNARLGNIPIELGLRIRQWLDSKQLLPSFASSEG